MTFFSLIGFVLSLAADRNIIVNVPFFSIVLFYGFRIHLGLFNSVMPLTIPACMTGTSCFRKFLFRETSYQFVVFVKYNPDNSIRNIDVVILIKEF